MALSPVSPPSRCRCGVCSAFGRVWARALALIAVAAPGDAKTLLGAAALPVFHRASCQGWRVPDSEIHDTDHVVVVAGS